MEHINFAELCNARILSRLVLGRIHAQLRTSAAQFDMEAMSPKLCRGSVRVSEMLELCNTQRQKEELIGSICREMKWTLYEGQTTALDAIAIRQHKPDPTYQSQNMGDMSTTVCSKFTINQQVHHKDTGEKFIIAEARALVVPACQAPIWGRVGFDVHFTYTVERCENRDQSLHLNETVLEAVEDETTA